MEWRGRRCGLRTGRRTGLGWDRLLIAVLFPLLIRLFFPTAILPQPQPQLPRWGLGAREVEWLAALHRGVAAVAAAPCRRALARAPLASAPPVTTRPGITAKIYSAS